jgi:hypothetical protein
VTAKRDSKSTKKDERPKREEEKLNDLDPKREGEGVRGGTRKAGGGQQDYLIVEKPPPTGR